MGNRDSYVIRNACIATPKTPESWKLEDVKRVLQATNPGRVTAAGQAYQQAGETFSEVASALNSHMAKLKSAWSGDAAEGALTQMRQLQATSENLAQVTNQAGQALERHGTAYLGWYKQQGQILGPGFFYTGGDDKYARELLDRMNVRVAETYNAMPDQITKDLPDVKRPEGPGLDARSTTAGRGVGASAAGPAGGEIGPGGPGWPGTPGIPESPGGVGAGSPPGGAGLPAGTPPGGLVPGGAGPAPGGGSGPGDLIYVPPGGIGPAPVGTGPGIPPVPGGIGPAPAIPGGLPGGGYLPGLLPPGGTPGGIVPIAPGRPGFPGSGTRPGAAGLRPPGFGGVLPAGGVVGAGGGNRSGLPSGAGGRGGGLRGIGPNGVIGAPMGAGQGGTESEGERTTWLVEDEDIWHDDTPTVPPVIG